MKYSKNIIFYLIFITTYLLIPRYLIGKSEGILAIAFSIFIARPYFRCMKEKCKSVEEGTPDI